MIKQKNTLLGNNSASSIKYQTSGFSRREMKLSPLFSRAPFPMKLGDSHEKILFAYRADKKKKIDTEEKINHKASELTLLTFTGIY